MSNIEIRSKVQELRELRRMAEELEAQAAALQNEIKAHMENEGVETIAGTDFKVFWTVIESRRFDKAAMIQAFGQSCYDEFCKTTRTRRFVVA